MPPRATPERKIFLIATEESGDRLGANLMKVLRQRLGDGVRFEGIGGRTMAREGLASRFAIEELSIIGFASVVKQLPRILRLIRETVNDVIEAEPDVLVIIDSPDFTHRVARRVRRRAPEIPILDYVSPTVWAWRPWRARAMRAYVDCVLAILPFEPAVYVELNGPPCLYVGHPLIERLAELRPNAEEAQRRRADPPLVLVLPGSRSSEIETLLAIFGAAIGQLAARIGAIELVLPTVPHLATRVRAGVAGWPVAPRVVLDPAEKWAAFRTARAALAASGTVTLELALAGVPTVAAYKVSLLAEIVMRLHSPLKTVILANLAIGERVVPEFLQRDCRPEKLADALEQLFADTAERSRQIEGFAKLDHIMAVDTAPSGKAAATVLDVARRGRRDVAAVGALRPR